MLRNTYHKVYHLINFLSPAALSIFTVLCDHHLSPLSISRTFSWSQTETPDHLTVTSLPYFPPCSPEKCSTFCPNHFLCIYLIQKKGTCSSLMGELADRIRHPGKEQGPASLDQTLSSSSCSSLYPEIWTPAVVPFFPGPGLECSTQTHGS